MKSGDIYESPSGLSFTIRNVTKKTVTVNVERVVRKNGKRTVDTRLREVPAERFELFASPYTKKKEP